MTDALAKLIAIHIILTGLQLALLVICDREGGKSRGHVTLTVWIPIAITYPILFYMWSEDIYAFYLYCTACCILLTGITDVPFAGSETAADLHKTCRLGTVIPAYMIMMMLITLIAPGIGIAVKAVSVVVLAGFTKFFYIVRKHTKMEFAMAVSLTFMSLVGVALIYSRFSAGILAKIGC